MYFATLSYAKLSNTAPKQDASETVNLILENEDDVLTYAKLTREKNSGEIIATWNAMKQNEWDGRDLESHMGYGKPFMRAMAIGASALIEQNGPLSVQEYIEHASGMFAQKMGNFLKMIQSGKSVRVNHMGGYCALDDFFKVDAHYEIDDLKIVQKYLISGRFDAVQFTVEDIKMENLVIENERFLSKEFSVTLKSEGCIQYVNTFMFTEFKLKTLPYEKQDYVKMFSQAVQNGLKNIFAETTMQDQVQIEELKQVLEYVMSQNSDKTLTVTIYLTDLQGDKNILTTKVPNLTVNVK